MIPADVEINQIEWKVYEDDEDWAGLVNVYQSDYGANDRHDGHGLPGTCRRNRAGCFCYRRGIPVSYTHLDVYKRQLENRS